MLVGYRQFIASMLCLICGITIYCMVGYGAEISISPSQQTLSCGSDYNFDIILNTSGSKVVSSDVKFFLNGLDLISIQGLGGFDQFNNVGTGVATKGVDIGKTYYYINFYQNSFSNFVSGGGIGLARLTVRSISGYNNGSIIFYNLSSNDDDSNIAVGVDYALGDMPINYVDNLFVTIDGNYIFDCNGGDSTGPEGGGGGGGGSTVLIKDDCPDGDNSFSYYDGSCGSHTSADFCAVDQSNYSSELKGAYIYSYMYGITTMCPIQDANIDGYLQRNHFSKMISEFSMNVLGKEPEVGKIGCGDFNDTSWDTEELQGFMTTACELNLMGLNSDGETPAISFNGGNYVTRAQFGTVFSRLLFGDEYNVADESAVDQQEGYWYKDHLIALRDNSIMTKIDGDWPNILELRGWVMLMMQRADNYGVFVGVIPALNGVDALFE